LFRADRSVDDDSRTRLRVLVQSVEEPDWSPIQASLESAEQKMKAWQFNRDPRFQFLLRANPTIRRKGSHDPATRDLKGDEFRAVAGHRVPVRGNDERTMWLKRKAEAGGFRIEAVRLQNTINVLWTKRETTRGKHEGVDFEGVLKIEEPELFGRTIQKGIGSAKAFGYGLLSIAAIGSL
jgi:CRISPR system Cascade subunit CasE